MTTIAQTVLADRRVLNLQEAADVAGVSRGTLLRLGKAGAIKITKMSPRRIGIRTDHLMAWLDERAA